MRIIARETTNKEHSSFASTMDQQICTVVCFVSEAEMDRVRNYIRYHNMEVDDISVENVEDELGVQRWKFTVSNENLEALKYHFTEEIEFRMADLQTLDISLRVTVEQRDEIVNFLQNRGWNNVVVNRPDRDQVIENYNRIRVAPNNPLPQEVGGEKCNNCFCMPCVTDERNRQLWWLQVPEVARWGNNASRKECYKKFWTFLYQRGVWALEEYLQKKSALMEARGANFIRTKREVMPECVVDLVRRWYPNPGDNLYMGHRWN